MTKEDFLFLMGDDPLMQDDAAFVDSFLFKGGGSNYGRLIADWIFDDENPGALRDAVNNYLATASGTINFSTAGACLDTKVKAITFPSDINLSNMNIIIRMGDMVPGSLGNNNYVFTFNGSLGLTYSVVQNKWVIWTGLAWDDLGIGSDATFFSNSIIRITVENGNVWTIYKNDVLIKTVTLSQNPSRQMYTLGGNSNGYFTMYIKGVQFYEVT